MLVNLQTYRATLCYFSNYDVAFADTDSGERWEAYTKNSTEIYVRRRSALGVWDPEILVSIGIHLDILYLNGHINLVFEHNGKIYWRAWPENTSPAFIKPPGLLTESVYFEFEDLSAFSMTRVDPIEPRSYDEVSLTYGDLSFLAYDVQEAPGVVSREDAFTVFWAAPGSLRGSHLLGYRLYHKDLTGVVTCVNSTLLPTPQYIGDVFPGTYFATACISPGPAGELWEESPAGSSLTVLETETWQQETVPVVGADFSLAALTNFEFYSENKKDEVVFLYSDLAFFSMTSTVLDYTPI
ncbi:MAG: hypothetical protein LHW56_01685 [Candidatus Cloacimonetes bacterium]|nr:hypothetical protein [Candidatus Cloacimonadota bacterium]MDY0171599.1 hypothetical protein [Candidatus Cloacimonadaceae bacterium]